jgi:ethanolamine ammonia-lyase small subunit
MAPCDPPDRNEKLEVANGLARLRRFTPARVGLGRAGSGQLTAAGLQFMLDHARARDAVYAALDFDAIGQSLRERGWEVAHVRSAAGNRHEYLRRPDLGRRLSPAGREVLKGQSHGSDIVIVGADGLSAKAIGFNLLPALDCLRPLLAARRLTVGAVVLVEQGRVAIGDEIGELLDAKLTVVLLGERPGLSSADSLGAYVTWRPRVGTTDSSRNCISNIRAAGLAPQEAASQIDDLIGRAFMHSATSVALNELRFTEAAIPAIENR